MTQATEKVATSASPRLNININAETADALRKLKQEKSMSATEIVRNAIALYEYLADEKKNDRRIQTTDANGKDKHDIVFL